VTLAVPINMHIIGTFATGQQRSLHLVWSPDPIGTFATCTGPPNVHSTPSPGNATPSSTLR
jgi:hypothetical protein